MITQKENLNSLYKKTVDLISIDLFKFTLEKFCLSQRCLLILDERASKFLSRFVNVSDVLSIGLLSLDSIYIKRKPYKNCSAIYIISSNENSIKLVLDDFQSKEKKLYKNCHLFFIDDVTDDTLNFILKNKYFITIIKTLKQISIKYACLDSNLFSFSSDENYNPIHYLYNSNDKIDEMNINRLVSICKVTKTFPNIIYFNPDKNCKIIAEILNEKLKKIFGDSQKNGIVFINSRFTDLTGPIIFDLIFSNLLLEIYKIGDDKNNNKIKVKINNEEKKLILNFKDYLYTEYKNMHFFKVLERLPEDFKEFAHCDAAKIEKIDQIKNTNEIYSALQNVTEYNTYKVLYSNYINICQELKKILEKRKFIEYLDLQKSVISSLDPSGKKITLKYITNKLEELKDNFNNNDLMRILCLIKYYLSEIDINEIFTVLEKNNIYFSQSDKRLINFINKGKCLVDFDKMKLLDKNIILYRGKNKYNTKEEKDNADDKRFICVRESKLTTLIDMCSKNELPSELFTYLEKPENFSPKKNKFHVSRILGQNDNEEDLSDRNNKKQNLIFFNIGGISQYEVSSIDRGNSIGQFSMNVIYGSNKIYNCKEYFEEIKEFFGGKDGIYHEEEDIPEDIIKDRRKKNLKNNKKLKDDKESMATELTELKNKNKDSRGSSSEDQKLSSNDIEINVSEKEKKGGKMASNLKNSKNKKKDDVEIEVDDDDYK